MPWLTALRKMECVSMGVSRRSFLHRVGAAGGVGAAYSAMVALGLMATPVAAAGPPQLTPTLGRGKSVLISAAGSPAWPAPMNSNAPALP